MAYSNNYVNYNNPFSPLTSIIVDDILNSSDPIEFNSIPTTPNGWDLSNNSSLSSPLQSLTNFDNELMIQHGTIVDNNGFECSLSQVDPRFDILRASPTEVPFNANQNEKLQIIAQPRAIYRSRYASEVDKEKFRAHRYIRTEDGDNQYDYPTIKIPSWCQPDQQLYIQVALVTVPCDTIPYHCIHPYAMNAPDQNAIEDKLHNLLSFRITENEFKTREKSFRIIIYKKKLDQLKAYGPIRLFDPEQHESVFMEDPQDPKRKIALYQLTKSQFIFTIAQIPDKKSYLVPLYYTSVKARIMTEEAAATTNPSINSPNGTFINEITCVPQQGNWNGGDMMLIILPNPIKGKEYTIYFNFGQCGVQPIKEITPRDTKTISFHTPSCPIPAGDENLKVSIIIQENNSMIALIDFYYLTPIQPTIYLCSRCQKNMITNRVSNKRRLNVNEEGEEDNGENLIREMDRLSIGKTTNKSRSRTSSSSSINEKLIKLDTRLRQMKTALETFVRTNDPSELFRQTSFLLSTYDGNSPALHDAIKNGHTKLALTLIEQIIDMSSWKKLFEQVNENGETPLLIAVKLNEWKLIECILKSRSDLAKQKDQNGNNLFHLLANLSEDKGAETIKNVLAILPNELKMDLLKEQNQTNEKPMDIAQFHNNTSSLKFLINIDHHSE